MPGAALVPMRPAQVIVKAKLLKTFVGLMVLGMGVFCAGSQGAVFDLMPHVSGPLQVVWRMGPLCLVFLLIRGAVWLAASARAALGRCCRSKSSSDDEYTRLQRRSQGPAVYGGASPSMDSVDISELPQTTRSLVLHLIASGLGYTWWVGSLIVALKYTSVGNVFLFNGAVGLALVAWRFARRQPLCWQEGLGTLVAIAGGCIVAASRNNEAVPGVVRVDPGVIGDFLAWSGSVGGAIYFSTAGVPRKHMGTTLFAACMQATGTVVFLIICIATSRSLEVITDPLHPGHGMLGWTQLDLLWKMAWIVLLSGVLGAGGYVASLQFLSPLIIGGAALFEPVVGVFFAVLLKVSPWPAMLTYVGAAVMLSGLGGVVYGSHIRETKAKLLANPVPDLLHDDNNSHSSKVVYDDSRSHSSKGSSIV